MKGSNIIMIVVVLVAAVIFLPRIMGSMKGFNLGSIFGGGAQASTGGGNGVSASGDQTATAGGKTGRMTDVAGNGCACSNGVCEGNCADMEQIDLENFDPLDWVQSKV